MLYEVVAIARYAGQRGTADAHEVCKHVGKLILNNRGVIRKVENLGVSPLPKIMNKNRQSNILGAHFYLKFDASAGVQREVLRSLRSDPRIVRSTLVKEGGDK
jgi:small subunit ribosomal protein S6